MAITVNPWIHSSGETKGAFRDILQANEATAARAKPPIYLGLDLAELSDYTALSAIQINGPELWIRSLKRFPKGTTYPDQARRVRSLILKLSQKNNPVLVIDKTGVGQPVYDIYQHLGISPVGITITSGRKATKPDRWSFHVPKVDLIAALTSAAQHDRLKASSRLKLLPALEGELRNFRAKPKASGRISFEPWREGEHDDLLFGVSLAVWYIDVGQYMGLKIRPHLVHHG